MFISTQTIWSTILDTSRKFEIPFKPEPGTTLNELYQIGDIPLTQYPTLNIFVAGLGPTAVVLDTVQLETTHATTDTNIYRPLPIRFMLKSADLTGAGREDYVLREERSLSGVDYVVYYGKKITKTNSPGSLLKLTRTPAGTTIVDFDTSKENLLKPIDTGVPVKATEFSEKTYIAYSKAVDVILTPEELTEMALAAKLIYGEDTAVIKEFGLVSSVLSDNEAYKSQVNFFISTMFDINTHVADNKTILRKIDIGGVEMLITR